MAHAITTYDVYRKRLRKGTHSCIQCRRRKVRCHFKSDSSEKCAECFERDDDCISQLAKSHVSRNGALCESPGRLTHSQDSPASTTGGNSSIQRHARALPGPASPPHRDTHAIELSASLPLPESAPHFSLFQPPTPLNHHPSHVKSKPLREADRTVLQDIKLYIPPLSDLRDILSSGGQYVWHLWLYTFPNQLKPERPPDLDEQIDALCALVYTAVHSDDCVLVLKVTLCLLLQIQQLPVGSRQTAVLQQKCLDSADSLLASDDGLTMSLEGVECLLLQVEYYICLGDLRKVWLIVRRATALAQMLGLHRTSTEADVDALQRQQKIWSRLWQLDRGFSLILGLPSITMDHQYHPIAFDKDEERFLYHLGLVMGQIVVRNQKDADMTYADTLEIDKALDRCAELMPTPWWQAGRSANSSPNEVFTHFSIKIRFHTTRKLLHLPFLMKAYKDARYERSRVASLQASRALVDAYHELRDENLPALKMCDMADFEAFCAAMTIVVDLVARDGEAAETDWQIVRDVAEDLRHVSQTVHCSMAAKGAGVLQDLCETRHRSNNSVRIDIPYFGKIEIRRAAPRADMQRDNFSIAEQMPVTYESTDGDLVSSLDGWLFPCAGASPLWQYPDLTTNMMADCHDDSDWRWFVEVGETI